ncbi:hypothetical protein H4S08_002113 [Coemansia sp. RSA 1365]|nr:hypothetical protein H4S08_002113 [Coemansia sp. RSA 1365]
MSLAVGTRVYLHDSVYREGSGKECHTIEHIAQHKQDETCEEWAVRDQLRGLVVPYFRPNYASSAACSSVLPHVHSVTVLHTRKRVKEGTAGSIMAYKVWKGGRGGEATQSEERGRHIGDANSSTTQSRPNYQDVAAAIAVD